MDVKNALETRRAYRSLDPIEVTDALIEDLAESARLCCSCFNNQPWRFVFVFEKKALEELHSALSKGNVWAKKGSLIVAVLSKPELDCIIKERKYYQFDTGMAAACLILRATELGLVAHPIAGYDPMKVREVLGIPDEMEVVTLIILGRHSQTISPDLSDKQVESEKNRPPRLPLKTFVFKNCYPKE